MALLGGFRGRLDYGSKKQIGQIDGPKYGAFVGSRERCCRIINHKDPSTRLPFMFVYKVSRHAAGLSTTRTPSRDSPSCSSTR
eukprot:9419564-Pyramimonas_sp.AAC.1